MYCFNDKVAIITGAAKGIGKAVTERFAEERANIIAIDIDETGLAELIKENKKSTKILGYAFDVSNNEKIDECIKDVLENYRQIHILVNNAGVRFMKEVFEYTPEDWTKTFNVNLMSMVKLCNAVLPNMIEHHYGKIINITSIVSKTGETSSIPYCSIKGAVSSFTKSMARYFAPYQIYFNAIAPHAIESDFIGYWDDEKRKRVTSSIPLKRMGTPQDIASVVLFLASEESNFIVGEIINVNGGYYMD